MNEDEIKIRWQEIVNLLRSVKREGIEDLISWLDRTDFKYAPASTKYHSNIKGGLMEHSLNVYYILKDDFAAQRELLGITNENAIIVSLLHDICKANIYKSEMRNVKRDGEWIQEPFYKKVDTFPAHHAEKSVIIAQMYIKLTPLEIMMMCGHMGYSDVPAYDARISDLFTYYPEALLLHFADMTATYMVEQNTEGMEKFNSCGFNDLFKGRSFTESLKLSKYIKIGNTEYEIAGEDAVVDNDTVILVKDEKGIEHKVYAPYGDGLPF